MSDLLQSDKNLRGPHVVRRQLLIDIMLLIYVSNSYTYYY